jgi:hypothetical protein
MCFSDAVLLLNDCLEEESVGEEEVRREEKEKRR